MTRNVCFQSESGPFSQRTGVGAGEYSTPWNLSDDAGMVPVGVAQKLILVIDDSTTVRKIVETSLGREGYQVKGFPDGIEAMRWLLQPGSHLPQLLFLDIGLPKIDGYDIARYLRSRSQFRDMIIIILTGRDGILDRLKGRLVGAQAYLTKPFKTQELIGVVTSYLGVAAS
jgi:twitching motility two-component system response regulator PilG